jgi:2-C-methyl-D-erythritol 4-phosphate cytidylyltransferase
MHTINRFLSYDPSIEVRVILPEEQIINWKELCAKYNFKIAHRVFMGGITRFQSVKNGLKDINPDCLIAIHDGVRPLVGSDTIRRCFKAAEECGAAIPVIDIQETVREINSNFSITVDRTKYKIVQTPQVFDAEIIINAYKQDYDDSFTDDAAVVESSGHLITLVDGNRENIKITTPIDLKIAETLISGNY